MVLEQVTKIPDRSTSVTVGTPLGSYPRMTSESFNRLTCIISDLRLLQFSTIRLLVGSSIEGWLRSGCVLIEVPDNLPVGSSWSRSGEGLRFAWCPCRRLSHVLLLLEWSQERGPASVQEETNTSCPCRQRGNHDGEGNSIHDTNTK